MNKKLTWRKQPNNTGLARITQGPRGYGLWLEGRQVASVSHYPIGHREYKGYYWSAPSNEPLGIKHRNTASTKVYDDIEEAKRECRAYIVSCLSEST